MVLLIFFPKKIDLFNTIKQDAKIREMNYDTYYSIPLWQYIINNVIYRFLYTLNLTFTMI